MKDMGNNFVLFYFNDIFQCGVKISLDDVKILAASTAQKPLMILEALSWIMTIKIVEIYC